MTSFDFTFNGIKCSGHYFPSTRAKGWIKVIFFEHSAVILPTSILSNNNNRIWVQNIQQGESVWPHELIQSMGESIELTIANKHSEAETNNKYQ
jgi:hypothetical protein